MANEKPASKPIDPLVVQVAKQVAVAHAAAVNLFDKRRSEATQRVVTKLRICSEILAELEGKPKNT